MTSPVHLLPLRQRADICISIACEASGADLARFSAAEPDRNGLQARRLAAWLMRERGFMYPLDIAAALGVGPEFVNQTLFAARRRLASRGLRLDGDIRDMALLIAPAFAPGPAEVAEAAASLDDCAEAIIDAFGITTQQLRGLGRAPRRVLARQSFCWLADLVTTASPKEIGRRMNRGRTMVPYGIAMVSRRAGTDALRAEIFAAFERGAPDLPALTSFARRLEALTRPPMPLPKPIMKG